ncbi:hypothetical protein MTO96_038380 [Rhipicephalus appendiculatus]
MSLVAAALLVAFVVLVLLKKSPWRERQTLRYCVTPDCLSHAELLTANLNRSVDPCEDFSAYVCSYWGRLGLRREHIKTPVDQMSIARMANFGTFLNLGTLKLPVGTKALASYESCVSAHDDNGVYLEHFRALMRDMGLYWPEPPPDNSNALEVNLALSYKWHVHLLFEMWDAGAAGGRQMARGTPHRATGARRFESLSDRNGKRKLYCILDGFLQRYLKNIGDHTRHMTTDAWVSALRKSTNLNPQLGAGDHILFTSEHFLDTVDGLFENHTHSQLLMHTAWLFVQFYSPIAAPSLLLGHFGDEYMANTYRSVFCAAHVETSHKVLVLSLDIASHITPRRQTSRDWRLREIGVGCHRHN